MNSATFFRDETVPTGEDSATNDRALLDRLREGEESAAADVFQRYFQRLTALARSRLSMRLTARIDADDIVMSAYRSFFLRARRGEFALEPGKDLWRLLVEITLHKLYRQTVHHSAQRRAAQRETADSSGAPSMASAREPSPETAVADELAALMNSLSSDVRHALELRLQGYEVHEIAQSLHKSERTVRRWLDEVKDAMRCRFPELLPATRSESIKTVRKTKRPKPAPLESLLPQPLLDFSDYTLVRQIGAGGSGKVYRAVVQPGGVVVAVKFIKRSLLRRPEFVERFVREAKIVAWLDHPGIIRIHGLGRTPNRGFFLAMDYHPRGDLQSPIAAGPIALTDALRWVGEAATAIQHAHEHGVTHCDLKPSNLLLADDGRIVVSDFGLARQAADVSPDNIAGTPAFFATEQLDARWGTIGPQTDVYGLGAVLYTLLSGQPPRVGSVQDVLAAVAEGRAVPPLINAPDDVAAICRRCLAARPSDRFGSAQELTGAIREAG